MSELFQDLGFRMRRFAARHLGVDTRESLAAGGGERQAAPTLRRIRADHRGRYQLAARYLRPGARVLDLACGVGYGASILARESRCAEVLAVDRSSEALAYGREHFGDEKIAFEEADALAFEPARPGFDLITSFETLEHLDAAALMPRLAGWLGSDGLLLASTPNQERLPYSAERYPYHLRHYTPAGFEELIAGAGLALRERFSQHDDASEEVRADWEGLFLLAVCARQA